MPMDINCPVDIVLIHERKATLTAAGMLVLSIIFLPALITWKGIKKACKTYILQALCIT